MRARDLLVSVAALLLVLYLVITSAPQAFRRPINGLLGAAGYSPADIARMSDGQAWATVRQ
jgi:hypothetical protein